MRHFDVFNGDADGICALRGDRVTVLDISLDRNREELVALLDRGVQVRYFDHHFAGPIPQHPGLAAGIDRLDPARLDGFLDEFSHAWQR